AERIVVLDGLVDDMRGRYAAPVGQDVRGDKIYGRGELGKFDVDVPAFTGGDGDRTCSLRVADILDQVVGTDLLSRNGLVADVNGVDVAVMAREFQRRANFGFVALLVLTDPGADCDLEAELGSNRRHQFRAAGRRIGADRLGIGSEGLEIGSYLFGRRRLFF